MKAIFRLPLVALAATLLFISALAQAQTTPANPIPYTDAVGMNPNADQDIAVVSAFVTAIVSGDQDKARSLAGPNFVGYGPARADSANLEQTLKSWQDTYKVQQNRKVSFVQLTSRVKVGPYKGDWVSLWGNYSFTQDGKAITFPFQQQCQVADGRVMRSLIYYDRLAVRQELGYKIVPPEVAKK